MHILECLTYHEMPPLWCSMGRHFAPYDDFHASIGGKTHACGECAGKRRKELRRRKKGETE